MNGKTRTWALGTSAALGITIAGLAGADFVKKTWEGDILERRVQALTEELSERANRSLKWISVKIWIEPSVDPRSEVVPWFTYEQIRADIEWTNIVLQWRIVADVVDTNPELKELRSKLSEIRSARSNEALLGGVGLFAGLMNGFWTFSLIRTRRRINKKLNSLPSQAQELVMTTIEWKDLERSWEGNPGLDNLLRGSSKMYAMFMDLPAEYRAAVIRYIEKNSWKNWYWLGLWDVVNMYASAGEMMRNLHDTTAVQVQNSEKWKLFMDGEDVGLVSMEPFGPHSVRTLEGVFLS